MNSMIKVTAFTFLLTLIITSCAEEKKEETEKEAPTEGPVEEMPEEKTDTVEIKIADPAPDQSHIISKSNNPNNLSLLEGELVFGTEEEYLRGNKSAQGYVCATNNDSGLPYFQNFDVATEDGDTISFDYESVEYFGDIIPKHIGLWATVYYQPFVQRNIAKVVPVGTVVEMEEGWEKIEGMLNAPDETEGDLPDDFFVKQRSGESIKFTAFIDEMITKHHGTEVAIYFMPWPRKEAREIHLVPPSVIGK
jgi:hypothetical protein